MDAMLLKSISRAMLAFQPTIRFQSQEDPQTVLAAALDYNPKALFYLSGYRRRSAGDRHEIMPQYINTAVRPDQIYVARTHRETIHMMCTGCGAFRRQMPVVIRKSVDLQKVVNEFHDRYAAFYSNLVEIGCQTAELTGNFIVAMFTFTYRIGEVKLKMMEQEVSQEVDRICKLLFTPDMPLEVKLYLAHNYLAVNTVYLDSEKNDLDKGYTQSAYGCLIRRRCVCQGFAEAFKRIMDHEGIPCEIACGQVVGSDEYHAWNIVDLQKEDGFVHIDPTWDAAGDRPGYLYFCRGDRYFEGKRIWPRELYPSCSGRYGVLSAARRYVFVHKEELLKRGISRDVLDC